MIGEAQPGAQSALTGPVGRSGASCDRLARRTLYQAAQHTMISPMAKLPSAMGAGFESATPL